MKDIKNAKQKAWVKRPSGLIKMGKEVLVKTLSMKTLSM
jgi:hypothetical protein